MEKTNKLTKRDLIARLVALVDQVEVENKNALLEFLDKEDKALVKRASQPTKAQKANEPLKEAVLEVLANAGAPMAVKDIQEAVGLETNQKATALLTSLVKAGKVVKTMDKKKSFYSIAE